MPIKSYKLGPGTLTLGVGALAVEAQCTAFRIVPAEEVETFDAIPVLSGEELAAEESASYRHTAEGTFLQDLNTAGVVAFTWTNKGLEVPFTYEPNTVLNASVEGIVRIVPLVIGGDEIKARPQSDFVWRIIGDPDPTWAA